MIWIDLSTIEVIVFLFSALQFLENTWQLLIVIYWELCIFGSLILGTYNGCWNSCRPSETSCSVVSVYVVSIQSYKSHLSFLSFMYANVLLVLQQSWSNTTRDEASFHKPRNMVASVMGFPPKASSCHRPHWGGINRYEGILIYISDRPTLDAIVSFCKMRNLYSL